MHDINSQYEQDQQEQIYSNLTVQRISFDEIENVGLLKEQLKLDDLSTSKSDQSSGLIPLIGTDFLINAADVSMVEYENDKYYTLSLFDPNNPQRVINMLLRPSQESDSYIKELLEYNLTPQERVKLSKNIPVGLEGKISYLGEVKEDDHSNNITTTMFGPCVHLVFEGEQPCGGKNDHGYGDPNCPHIDDPDMAAQPPNLIIIDLSGCGGSGNGSGNGGLPGIGDSDEPAPGTGSGQYNGGGSSSGGSNPTNPGGFPTSPDVKPSFYFQLPVELKFYWDFGLDSETKQNILDYSVSPDFDLDFLEWMLTELKEDPNLYENWFGAEVPPNDFGQPFNINDYSQVDPETYSSLPSLNDFYAAFPKNPNTGGEMDAKDVYELVGGSLWDAHNADDPNYQNACTIRVSRGLNYNNQPIPVFYDNEGNQKTQKGGDNMNYVLNVSAMLAYMKKAYPNVEPIHLKNKTKEEYLNAIKGKWGVYIMLPKSGTGFTASGHADLFGEVRCFSGCYFKHAKEIYFWELSN